MYVEAAAGNLPDPEPEHGVFDDQLDQVDQLWLLRAQEMHSSSPLRRSKPSASDGKS